MDNLLQRTYLGKQFIFTSNGWINATQTLKVLTTKRLDGFMKSKYFKEYLDAFCKYHQLNYEDVVKTVKGNFGKSDPTKRGITQGTYFHPDLVVLFARWINPDFAVWCDDIIKQILGGEIELKFKGLREELEQLEEKQDILYEQLKLYQRPPEDNDTPQV